VLVLDSSRIGDISPLPAGQHGRAIQVQGQPESGPATATLRTSAVERTFEAAIAVTGNASMDLETCLVRDTSSRETLLGDGIVTWSHEGLASSRIFASQIENSERAAVSSFGAHVRLGSLVLQCQAFDLAAEPWNQQPASYEDLGGVLCGCPEANGSCFAETYALEPPQAIGGLE